MGHNIAPGIGRSFVAEDWRWLDRRIWREARTEARDLRQPRMVLPILGFDHDPSAIRLSEKGANEAGVAGDIQFRCQEVSDFRTNAEYGVVITNPPYGERLGDPEEVAAVYRELGRVTASLPTWGVYAITSNRGFEQQFGRRAPRRRKLFNGRLECQFYQYPGPPPRRADGSAEIPAETQESVDTVETPITATAEPQEIWQTSEWLQQAQLMLDSYSRHTGRQLLERSDDPIDEARRLYHAPFVVVSHGTQADPILNYGNLLAQQLWEMDAQTLTSIPSRLTAEPMHRDERAEMMARALRDGFVDDYRGIRISRTGKRFLIERAVIWNLQDAAGRRLGQAATFSDWKPLDPGSPPADSAETTVAPKPSD